MNESCVVYVGGGREGKVWQGCVQCVLKCGTVHQQRVCVKGDTNEIQTVHILCRLLCVCKQICLLQKAHLLGATFTPCAHGPLHTPCGPLALLGALEESVSPQPCLQRLDEVILVNTLLMCVEDGNAPHQLNLYSNHNPPAHPTIHLHTPQSTCTPHNPPAHPTIHLHTTQSTRTPHNPPAHPTIHPHTPQSTCTPHNPPAYPTIHPHTPQSTLSPCDPSSL